MNKCLFLALFFIGLFSCKQANTPQNETVAESNTPIVNDIGKSAFEDLQYVEQYLNQMPKEAKLFEQKDLTARLKSLLKTDFDAFMADWQNESKLKKDGEIIYAIGCKSDDCFSSRYVLIFDLLDNNINIYHYNFKKTKTYEEKSIIGMSSILSDDFAKISQEQGI